MNGPEHYAEAERLLREAEHIVHSVAPVVGSGAMPASEGMVIVNARMLAAQVHATLAAAAAVIDAQRGGTKVWESWPTVADPRPSE